jgi:hypothetical protein
VAVRCFLSLAPFDDKDTFLQDVDQIVLTTITATHRFRFVCNGSAYSGTLTFEDFADLMCVATSATTAKRLWDAVRVREVEVWAANSAGDSSNTVEIEYLQTLNVGGPGFTFSDTAMGLQNVAHICTRPPKLSRTDFWLSNSTGASGNDVDLIRLAVPKGGVVDVTLDFAFYDNDAPINVTGAIAGATTGKIYCRPLDSASGTAILVPVSYDFA